MSRNVWGAPSILGPFAEEEKTCTKAKVQAASAVKSINSSGTENLSIQQEDETDRC